jgi:hypothetical protein
MTTTDASEGLTASVDLMIMVEAPKASPASPTLEGYITLKTFLPNQRRWLAVGAAASTHLHPAFLVFNSDSSSTDATWTQIWS